MPEPEQLPTSTDLVAKTLEWETVATTHADITRTVVEESLKPGKRLTVGTRVGDYEIVRRVGGGGMGEVYAACRASDGSMVALKVLSDVHAARLYRFKREFRALADVKHDNLVALDELIVLSDGRAFFTMELIDGVDFVAYVRGDTPKRQLPNPVRLERALRQLILGVHHLHLHRCVHRDIKPSNVLVTREGRVVILDFGVISELAEADEGLTRDGQMMGTPAFMAPEQAGGQVAGPPADYYAIGTMLFECLTGVLPFSGSVLDILIDKRHGEVPDPRAQLDGRVTKSERIHGLVELCVAALAIEPEARPSSAAFLAALGESSEAHRVAPAPILAPRSAVHQTFFSDAPTWTSGPRSGFGSGNLGGSHQTFVGRARELAELDDAFARVRARLSPITVHIRGGSGQGKSTLVARFLGSSRERGDVVILRGRCLERESVPYKGIDAVVDALSIYLRRLDEVDAARLQPRHLAPLLQLFPVLDDAWDGAARLMDLDPGELRRRGFAALREVLAKLGEQRPLIVFVDDFQWADVDSARLLTELMRPPDPPAMLLVITYRDEVGEREVLQLLTEPAAIEGREVRELEVGPLSPSEASELAAALLDARAQPSSDSPAVSAEALARRAQGNPFYIGQMVLGDDPHQSSDASLDRLVARRIVALEPSARRVLATVAVAAGPTPITVILSACQAIGANETVDDSLGDAAIEALIDANLLRRSAEDDDRIETAHDRIRVVAVGELSPTELRATHRALGESFEALGGGELEALAEHFNVGGDELRALDYTEKAAADAASALAFDRAAQLYRRALGLLANQAEQPERRRTLELALAEQLVDLGRGAEAAEMFIRLADDADSPKAARELRRRAASELVKAGYLDEGLDTMTPVLRELRLSQPRSTLANIVATLWNRLLLSLRGYRFERRTEAEIDPGLLERIDSLLATKTGLSHNEAIIAGYQQARAIRLALRAGEPRRLIRCLVHEAAIMSAIGKTERGKSLMDTARELVTHVVEPEFRRVLEYVDALHHDHQGRWPAASTAFARLHERLDESPNSGWIRGASTVQWMYVHKLLGDYAMLRAELPRRLATARDLGVRHEQVSLGSLSAYVHAIYGEHDVARRLLDEAHAAWHPRYCPPTAEVPGAEAGARTRGPRRGVAKRVTYQHIVLALTEVEVALLGGRPEAALAEAERILGDFTTRIVAKMMPSQVEFHELRARSRIQAFIAGVGSADTLAWVRRDLVEMRRSHKPQVGAQALVIEAAVLGCEGDWVGAEARWRAAKVEFERLAMAGQVAAVDARLGELGDHAAKLASATFFTSQGLSDPTPLIDALAPSRQREPVTPPA